MKFDRLNLLRCLLPLLAAGLLHAQTAELQNTVIDCEQFDMRSTETEAIFVFTGKVVATSTNQRITCERLEVVAIKKADPTATIGKFESFKSFIATGNVRIIQGDREAACGRAEVRPGEDKVVLTGQPVVVDHSVNWTWTGDELEMLSGEHQIRGKNAHFTGPPMKDLGADKPKPAEPASAPATAPKQP